MLFCTGRTYSPKYLDMEAKLNLILKELQGLKFIIDELESKSNKETLKNRESRREDRNDRRRDERTSRPRINENDIIRRIKIDPLTFDGILDTKIFSDWMSDLDYYFDWYKFTEKSRIRFIRMRLIEPARIYWISVERVNEA